MALWETVLQTVVEEFSDLDGAEEATQLIVRLLVAAVLGAVLGYERERMGKAAGVRTHMLVAASSALIVLVPVQSGLGDDALSRIIQGLLAGVGFVCAGAILKLERAEQVQGLTTAAGVWMTSAVGIAAGLGREMTALIAAGLVLGVLALEGPLLRLGVPPGQDPED
jgi:putative Mg2+ transporter-C (MgtC) family protein